MRSIIIQWKNVMQPITNKWCSAVRGKNIEVDVMGIVFTYCCFLKLGWNCWLNLPAEISYLFKPEVMDMFCAE